MNRKFIGFGWAALGLMAGLVFCGVLLLGAGVWLWTRSPQSSPAVLPAARQPIPTLITTTVTPQLEQPTQTSSEYTLKVGAQAADFSLHRLNGDLVQLSDFRGKVVLVNFWATWCPPCREEMPLLEKAYQQFSPQLVILGINEDDDLPATQSMVDQFGLAFPILLDHRPWLDQRLGIVGYPTSMFIDPQGIIQSVWVGGMDQSTLDAQLRKVGLQP